MALQPLVAAGDEDVAVLQTEFLRHVPECLSPVDDHESQRSNLIQPPADGIDRQSDAVMTDDGNEQAVASHAVVVSLECASTIASIEFTTVPDGSPN